MGFFSGLTKAVSDLTKSVTDVVSDVGKSVESAAKKVIGSAPEILKAAAVGAAAAAGGVALAGLAGVAVPITAGAAAMTAFTMGAVSGTLGAALAPDAPSIGGGFAPAATDSIRSQLVQTRAPNASARIVYGRTRVAGNIVFMDTLETNSEMWMAMTLAGHEINSVQTIYANDEAIKTNPSFDTVYTYDHNGETVFSYMVTKGYDNGSDPKLLPDKYEEYRFNGLAVLIVKMFFRDGDYWVSGIPNFSVELTGKNSSKNAATAIKNYLQDTVYGLGVTDAEIDSASFSAAEATCDENVALAAGGTEKRYTVNGVVSSEETPDRIISKMLVACDGRLSYCGGKWFLNVGEYQTPTVTITENDIIGAIAGNRAEYRADTFNAVKGTYSEPTSLYNPQTYQPVENSLYESEDGEKIWQEIDFQMVTSNATCQRLAKIALERVRQQITVSITCNLKAFKLKPGDTVQLTLDRYGWDQKVFEVIEWTADMGSLTPGVNLFLKETAAGVYDWNSGEETQLDLADNTNLPNPLSVNKPGVTVTDELDVNAERVITKLVINVTGTSFYSARYEVQAKISSSSTWINVGLANGNIFELLDAKDGFTYNVRARIINTLGAKSAWTTVNHQTVGKLDNPSDVTGLAGNLIGNQYLLSWNPISDLDLSHYKIRFAPPDGSPTYRNSVDVVPKVSRPATSVLVPARNGTYFVKAVDKVGLKSLNAATIVLDANIDGLNDLNVVQTITEHPDFTGTFDDVVFLDDDDRLVLDTSLLFDDVTGNFDDADGVFDSGSGNVDGDGFYYFANSTDLGAIYTSRVNASLKHVRLDYSLFFDSADGLFDDRPGDFDGDPDAFDDTNAELQIRTTGGDPAGSPTWSAWQPFVIGDYTFRAAEYRVRMTTTVNDATPSVSELTVTVDMPDRVESESDLSTSSGAKVVTFPTAFKETPALGIGAQDMATGDYYVISAKSRSGFTITFRDSGGSVVSTERTFDYVAKGYGRESA